MSFSVTGIVGTSGWLWRTTLQPFILLVVPRWWRFWAWLCSTWIVIDPLRFILPTLIFLCRQSFIHCIVWQARSWVNFACWRYCAMLIVREIYALSVSYILYMFYREFWLTICPAWTSSICFARVMRTSSIVRAGSTTHRSPTLWSLMFRFLSRIVVCHVGVMAGPEVLEPELEDTVSRLTNDQCFSIWTISTSQWTFSAYIYLIIFKPISDFAVVCYLKF